MLVKAICSISRLLVKSIYAWSDRGLVIVSHILVNIDTDNSFITWNKVEFYWMKLDAFTTRTQVALSLNDKTYLEIALWKFQLHNRLTS